MIILSYILGIIAIAGYLTIFLTPLFELVFAFIGTFIGIYVYNQNKDKNKRIFSGIGTIISIVALLLTTIGYTLTLYSNIGL